MAVFKSNRGLNWHYDASGCGEAILFIHGFGGSGAVWSSQREFLAKDFQVITLDLPGHGKSEWQPVTLLEMAMDIRQLLGELGGSQVSVVASSLGALLAMELYRGMPEHIMRLSLVGAIPKFAQAPNYSAGLDIHKIRTLSQQFDGDIAAILDIFFRSLFTMKERDSERFKCIKAMRAQEPLPQRAALKAYLDILETADLRDRIASIICPLQFITGSEDTICPRGVMDWVAQHTYNARFDFIEGCGHLPYLTQVDEYNRLLEDFLIH